MSTIGRKGPPQRSPDLQRFLEAERQKRSGDAAARDVSATQQPGSAADRFSRQPFADAAVTSGPQRASTGTFVAPASLQGTPAQGALSVRLGAMTGTDMTGGVERSGLRVVHGPAGKVADGDLSVRRAGDLDALNGVVLLRGSLDLSETTLTAADLEALSSLERIEGGLALEGNAALASLDALSHLSHVGGNLYLGFNDGLERADLPALTRVGGALIVEGNAALQKLSLPRLSDVAAYLHLHENQQLADVRLSGLRELGGELSLLDNPLLHAVDLSALRVTPPSIS